MKAKKKIESYRVNETTLNKMKKQGIPEDVIKGLKGLRGERFLTSEDFVGALEGVLGIESTLNYKEQILDCTRKYSKKTGKKEVNIPHFKIEQSEKIDITANSGLFLLAEFIKKVNMIESFSRLNIFSRQKITEACHVMVLVLNQFCGGDAVKDTEYVDKDQALKAIFGDIHIPAPHTSGDFLERFVLDHVETLRNIIHKFQDKMMRKLAKKMGKNREIAASIDSAVYEVYGNTKEGSAMSYKRIFGYHPLLMHLNTTGEMLDIYLREGNAYTSTDAVKMLTHNITRLVKYFDTVVILGDSGFFEQGITDLFPQLEKQFKEQYKDRTIKIRFIITSELNNPIKNKLSNLQLTWTKYEKPVEEKSTTRNSHTVDYRLENLKENLAKKNKVLKTRGDMEFTEFVHEVPSWKKSYRFVFKRQEIIIDNLGSQLDFIDTDTFFFHGYVTNFTPEEKTPQQIIALIDSRGNQEKFIGDLKHGLGTTHIPTKHFYANYAYFLISMLSWNLKCWILSVIEPDTIIHWKRFRYLFVKVGAQIIKSARYVVIRFGKGFDRFKEVALYFQKITEFQLEN